VVRNEVGVVAHAGGGRNAATVFTRSRPDADDTALGRAVGAAAARAVAALRAGVSTA
jgi:beta-lactamase class A